MGGTGLEKQWCCVDDSGIWKVEQLSKYLQAIVRRYPEEDPESDLVDFDKISIK
jgi:hypothetical protein